MKETKLLIQDLESHVRELCQPEGRMVGTDGHKRAEKWVAQKLSEIGCEPYSGESYALPYEREGISFTNFAGSIAGKDRDLPPILIGAHYDSVISAPCADDNGSAVAITLAVGESIAAAGGLNRDLVVAIFDAEEPPYFQTSCMGSNRFYHDQADERNFHFALISDLVGHDVCLPEDVPKLVALARPLVKPLAPLTFMTGAESHPQLPEILKDVEIPDRMKLIATLNRYVDDMSDHGVFRRNYVPYLFLSCGRWEHYHRPTDTPEKLNYEKMGAIAQYAERVCWAVSVSELGEFADAGDPIDFEAETWKQSLGMMRRPLAKLLGVSDFKTRDQIDRAAEALTRLGL